MMLLSSFLFGVHSCGFTSSACAVKYFFLVLGQSVKNINLCFVLFSYQIAALMDIIMLEFCSAG